MVEQYYTTSNPLKNGYFDTWARSDGYDKETEDLVKAGYKTFQTSVIEAVQRDENTSRERVLKSGAKKNIFGRYRESDYEWREVVVRNKIEIIDETVSGQLILRNIDFRANPEKAPYRIAKMVLNDNRILVARITAIGVCYGDVARYGNYFNHGFIFPAGTILTDEQIKNLPFVKGLSQEQQKNGIPPKLPTLNESQLLHPQKVTPPKTSMPKAIHYGQLSVPTNSPLGEIEEIISSIGIEEQEITKNSYIPTFVEFEQKLKEKNNEITDDEIKERYEDFRQSRDSETKPHEDNLEELKEKLEEKMKAYPHKDVLKTFLAERKQYYRQTTERATSYDKTDCSYQTKATTDAQSIFHFKVENKIK